MKQALVWIAVALMFFVFFSYRYSGMQERKISSPSAVDNNHNGFPDTVELYGDDAVNFYRWFASIAISQSYMRSKNWSREYDDCSGLVRFSFVEALKKHTPDWFEQYPYLFAADIPSVKNYNYPNVPVLGISVFKVGKDKFGRTATAKQLIRYNLRQENRTLRDLKVGDIVIFFQPSSKRYVMVVFCGNALYAWQQCGYKGYVIKRASRLPPEGELMGVYSWIIARRER